MYAFVINASGQLLCRITYLCWDVPDIYQTITNQIIDALEQVKLEDYKAPFAMLSSQKAPINPTTDKHYRGINTLILWLMQAAGNHSSNEWATFKQWKDKGAFVKKGEKSSQINLH